MERISLKAEKRETQTKGQLRQLRASGYVPAILYGKKQEPVRLVVPEKELDRATSTHAGFNALIDLSVGEGETFTVLIRDYQAHPLRRKFTHVDFRAIDVTEKIEVEVPIELVGESIGVKEGGILEQLLRKVQVYCLPTNIPESFQVNVTGLKIGDSVHTTDITLPEGVEFLKDAEYTVATVVPPVKEEVVVPPEAVAVEGAPVEGAPPAEGAPEEGAEAGKKGEVAAGKKAEGGEAKGKEKKPEGEKK